MSISENQTMVPSATEPVTWPAPVAPRWSAVPLASVPAFVADVLRRGGERPALVFDDGFELACGELLRHAERLAAGLAPRISPGDRVAIAIGNRAEFFISLFAVAAVRGVAVTLSPGVQREDARYMLQDSGTALAIADGGAADVIAGVAEQCPALERVLRLDGLEPNGLAAFYGDRRLSLDAHDAPVDEMLDIGYTSGTTGLPKALHGDHAEALGVVDDFLRIHPFGPGDRMLSPLQFHYGDPIWLLYASLVVGSPLIAMRRFSVSRFWTVARGLGATHICTIGAIPSLLLTAQPNSAERDHGVRYAAAVGVPAAQHRELVERFGVTWLEIYGSSEAGTVIGMPAEHADRYIGTGAIGIPAPHVTVRLVDGDGAVVDGPGSGEREIGGDFRFSGYLGNDAATAEVMHDGWFRTGDLDAPRCRRRVLLPGEAQGADPARRGEHRPRGGRGRAAHAPDGRRRGGRPGGRPAARRGSQGLCGAAPRPRLRPRRTRRLLPRAAGGVQGAALLRAAGSSRSRGRRASACRSASSWSAARTEPIPRGIARRHDRPARTAA